jgi:hypothetical protein
VPRESDCVPMWQRRKLDWGAGANQLPGRRRGTGHVTVECLVVAAHVAPEKDDTAVSSSSSVVCVAGALTVENAKPPQESVS